MESNRTTFKNVFLVFIISLISLLFFTNLNVKASTTTTVPIFIDNDNSGTYVDFYYEKDGKDILIERHKFRNSAGQKEITKQGKYIREKYLKETKGHDIYTTIGNEKQKVNKWEIRGIPKNELEKEHKHIAHSTLFFEVIGDILGLVILIGIIVFIGFVVLLIFE